MQIIIPMAGKGERFQAAGYVTWKPFIEVFGKSLINLVLDSVADLKANTYIISTTDFRVSNQEQFDLLEKRCQILLLTEHTTGSASSIYAMKDSIDMKDSLLILDSDTIFDSDTLNDYLADCSSGDSEFSLITFNANTADFSFVKINKENEIIDIAEKQTISNDAVAGAYWFREASLFYESLLKCYIHNGPSNNEYYVSNVIKRMILDSKLGRAFSIGPEKVTFLGTPKQLENFTNKITQSGF